MSLFTKSRTPAKPSSSAKAKGAASVSTRRPGLLLPLHRLPLNRFVDCLVGHEYYKLIAHKQPGAFRDKYTARELKKAWEAVYLEYLSAIRSKETEFYMNLRRTAALLRDEILNVSQAVYYLSPDMEPYSYPYTERLVAALNGYGYKLTLEGGRRATVPALNSILSKLAPKKLKLADIERQLDEYVTAAAAATEGQPIDREFFGKQLRILSRWVGYPLKSKELSAADYAGYINDYNSHIEKIKAERELKGGNE